MDWPAETFADGKSPFVFGLLGDNPFGNTLNQAFSGKILNGHPVVVRIFHNLPEASHCQILFNQQFGKRGAWRISFKACIQGAFLTVGESDRFH